MAIILYIEISDFLPPALSGQAIAAVNQNIKHQGLSFGANKVDLKATFSQ